ESVGGRPAVQFADDLQSILDARVLAGDPTAFAVVAFSELPVSVEHFDHGPIGIALQSSPIGEEFGDQAVVLSPAGCGVPLAEVQVPAVDGDDSLPCGLVAAVGRDAKSERSRHGCATSRSPNPVVYRISLNLRLHCR